MPKQTTWREYYAPQIAAIIQENERKTTKELKKILQDANPGPWGHQRKIWSNEYMRQLGLSKKKSTFVEDKNQTKLF